MKFQSLIGAVVLLLAACGGGDLAGPPLDKPAPPLASSINALLLQAPLTTVTFSGKRSNYAITHRDNIYVVSDSTGLEAPRTFVQPTTLVFADLAVAIAAEENSPGKIYRMYRLLNRNPNESELGAWINYMEKGASLTDVANAFAASPEFTTFYGSSPAARIFIAQLYRNVLMRNPSEQEVEGWVSYFAVATMADVIEGFTESAENHEIVLPQIKDGISFVLPEFHESSSQYIARTVVGAGSVNLTDTRDRFIFSGCMRKYPTSDPRTLGTAAYLLNSTAAEYRLLSFSYVMDTSDLLPNEAVESDIGFSVLSKDQSNALNSGEELLITHRYDAGPADRGVTQLVIPAGGFAIKANQKLSVGSVSAIFESGAGGAQPIPAERLAAGTFMRVCFSADIVRSDNVPVQRITSYRSPFRDRAYVADPARATAPYTDFKNSSSGPIKVFGIGMFISNLTSTEPSEHTVDVFVNGRPVTQVSLPSHTPGVSSETQPIVHSVPLVLNQGDVLSVRGKVATKRALVFDFAAFILAEEGLTPINEQLDVLAVDFNGDGYNDILDIDATGSVWVSTRVGAGLQDTQLEWSRAVLGVQSLKVLPRITPTDPLILQATNAQGLCLNMRSVPARLRFVLDYCANAGSQSALEDVWGDFNGDGWPDRLRVSADPVGYRVALGSAEGLKPESQWVTGYGAVEKMFAWDSNADGRTDLMAEWFDPTGHRCLIWLSTGSSFVPSECRFP